MSVSYKYWNDCVKEGKMKLLWKNPEVRKEWVDAGFETNGKVLISRDPEGQLYLTQTEMRAVAETVIRQHFNSQIEPDMICAIAEIASGRQLLAECYDRKTKQSRIGIMQIAPEIAEWLVRDMGYRKYEVEGNPAMLFKPFVNVYFGAAYIKWLSSCDGKERTEEFVIRAYNGGIKKANHKSTVDYFRRYLSIRDSLHTNREEETDPLQISVQASVTSGSGEGWACWDFRVSPEDMEELWRHPQVLKEWTKSGERHGRVRFSLDPENRPYLSQVEVKAVAEIIISQHFGSKGIVPSALAALAEVCSMRFVNGVRTRTGLMGIDYPTANWLSKDVGYRAYKVKSVDDLYNPFVSMYFGASYFAWLSQYEGRQRHLQFIVQAYLGGPTNVNIQDTIHFWKKYQQALSYYGDQKKNQGSCCIL
ncbi:hypothetical protein Cni_G21037 [Canna indica]|uniref:Transglycosylase SLT domain-containing protein n=1 Tax=Canna indica TaxID=4628 RepID=A0AAQ3QKC3_9LILI|nr:hypothetical protein Cni_G21037 [Canna indica]